MLIFTTVKKGSIAYCVTMETIEKKGFLNLNQNRPIKEVLPT